MANIASAKKRAIQDENRRVHNMSLRSNLRTTIKKVLSAITQGDLSQAKTAYGAAQPVIDRMAHKRIIARNAAARYKSRLNAKIKKLFLSQQA